MSKKIVIVGALGYLGTELCKLYSGESWFNKVVAIDSRFVSERISQLKNWNIEFHQGHILDKEFLKRNLNDADIVYHLAGITDVTYVKKESKPEKDEKIKKIAIEGTNNILDSIPQKCKIIFPSTHVIFEGLNKTKKNIDENENPCPILAYSSSKAHNGKIKEFILDPSKIGITKCKKNELIGNNPKENAKIILDILSNKINGAKKDIVLYNCAAALMIAGKTESISSGFQIANDAIKSGSALNKLNNLIKISNNQ